MESMIDPNRLNRVHVVNVRMKDNKYVVVLSDGSEQPFPLDAETLKDLRDAKW